MAQQYRAWIGRDLEEHGMAWALVVRERTAGWCEVGAFLVDTWCLGVKDAYLDEMPSAECEGLLEEQLPAEMREEIEPSCVRKLVEGAVAYAQSLGFLPHRDFKKARRVFGSIKATDCAREFTFGREGRPCFMAGPDDDQARINRVLGILTARLGSKGFDFVDTADEEEGESAEDLAIDGLFRFIGEGRCPDRAFTGYEALGFITGLWIQPDLILPSEWMAPFWGGVDAMPVFRDKAEGGAVAAGMMTLYNQVGSDLDAAAYGIGLPEHDAPEAALMVTRYCTGVLRGIGLRPKVLSWLRSHPDGAPAVALLESCVTGVWGEYDRLEEELVGAVTKLRDLAGELGRLGRRDGA